MNNDMEARAIRALLDIIMRPKESDYARSTNGLVDFAHSPAPTARVNELARLGYDREWNK